MSEVGYTVENEGDIYTLRMSGTINAETLPRYREIVDNLMKELNVAERDNLKFIVDYGKIDDVDSAALANILDRLKNDVRRDHKVVFINVPEKFKAILEIHKMENLVEIYASEQEAKAALQ